MISLLTKNTSTRLQNRLQHILPYKCGVKTLNFGGDKELIVERSDYPKTRMDKLFKNDTFAWLGYGTQGRGQALNMRDQGLNIIVGLRENGPSWNLAIKDGFIPNKTLFKTTNAVDKATVVGYLMSDAGQSAAWPEVSKHIKPGQTLFFSHGFSIVYKEDTKVIPPKNIDVVLVAPKGSGTTVRSLFLEGRGINASVAVHQDVSGLARDRAFGLAVGVGSGYMYETTFEKEVYSDLTGERGILMGAIQGLFLAQYEVLRDNGHSPSEAFNETVEEATQSLYPLIAENGMDWMYANCSTTAQRGALDWYPKFAAVNKPIFEKLYAEVKNGNETRRSLEVNSLPNYKELLQKELDVIQQSEMWQAGKIVRSLRPERT